MKKILAAAVTALMTFAAGAQVLPKVTVQNTLWTGMGLPEGDPRNDNRAGFTWYGLVDTLQARVDIAKFTLEGGISWGLMPGWDGRGDINGVTVRLVNEKPYTFLHQADAYKGWWDNSSYYVNFLWTPVTNFYVGAGTTLDWSVGAAPSKGGKKWAISSHVTQGDLRNTTPRGDSVSGFLYYPNAYAETAIGAKYDDHKMINGGIAIADGSNGKGFWVNTGIEFTPIQLLTVAFAYDGIGRGNSNLYAGATLRFTSDFILDAYFAYNGLGNDNAADRKFGTGATVTWRIKPLNLTVAPEAGFTFYSDNNYTFAFFTGGRVQFDITKQFHVGCWVSGAWGADDKRWHDRTNHPALYAICNTWTGGAIFNIRPEVTFDITNQHTIAATFEYQAITNANNTKYDAFMFGFYYRYLYQ
ncbi:MAG: hypothetical protein MJ169_01140 [Treponema sp.]|nr:hypothetical protein [Treponema sp.]